ncbi:hypothetical protein DFH09DRAFT_940035 [Mycena vulgaris]|nr:hypothetical protein DFH09DRAFT_940035 [Mycena vulgaris]
MNKNLTKWEDNGWIGVPAPAPLQALAARLRSRRAPTTFVKTDSADMAAKCKQASVIAKDAIENECETYVETSVPENLLLRGAKLSTLTQAMAYQGIRELQRVPIRKTTEDYLGAIRLAVKSQNGHAPSPAKIWCSIRHKDISRTIKTWLWKSIHGAHRVGSYWSHIPECGARATCSFCEETESLEHVLLECRRPGRAAVWKLASEMWEKKTGQPLLVQTIGAILGCALTTFEVESRSKPSGVNRLYRILISESAYLIWKLRNECVITNKGVPPSENEVHNKWVFTMNERLEIDRFLTVSVKVHEIHGKNHELCQWNPLTLFMKSTKIK